MRRGQRCEPSRRLCGGGDDLASTDRRVGGGERVASDGAHGWRCGDAWQRQLARWYLTPSSGSTSLAAGAPSYLHLRVPVGLRRWVRSHPERTARAATRSLRLCSSTSRSETGGLRLQKRWAWSGEDSTIAVGSGARAGLGRTPRTPSWGTKVHPQKTRRKGRPTGASTTTSRKSGNLYTLACAILPATPTGDLVRQGCPRSWFLWRGVSPDPMLYFASLSDTTTYSFRCFQPWRRTPHVGGRSGIDPCRIVDANFREHRFYEVG